MKIKKKKLEKELCQFIFFKLKVSKKNLKLMNREYLIFLLILNRNVKHSIIPSSNLKWIISEVKVSKFLM